MVQEKIDNWMQDAKELARAERELKIERWVYITFEYKNIDRSREILHTIDIPISMYERWQWMIEWRKAKLTCLNPRKKLQVFYCYYDKRTGLQIGCNFLLSRVVAAKAQVTKAENAIVKYSHVKSHNDLFFDANTDEYLHKAEAKLAQKQENYNVLYSLLQNEVKRHKQNPGIYKLFIGFNKIGEFATIQEASDFADRSKLKGIFNLIGDKYKDSWYV